MTTNNTNVDVREALAKALGDLQVSEVPEHRPSERLRSVAPVRRTVTPAPAPVIDPKFAAYGESLLAACRTDVTPVDDAAFHAWRARHPELQGTGAGTQLRLYRAMLNG